MIERKKLFENEDSLTPLDNSSAYDNQNVTHTGGGRVPNYPVSNSSYRWVISQMSYRPAFASGYFEDASYSELQRLFLGTNISAERANDLNIQKIEARAASDAAQAAETAYLNDVWLPAYETQLALATQLNNAGDYAGALAALAVLNAYDAQLNALRAEQQRTVTAYVNAITAHGTYIVSGKINNPDPLQLDDPTVAAALERKKRNEQIDKELEKLAKDNERLQNERGINAMMAIIGLGFDIATAIAILNVFSGPADEAALIAGKIGTQEMLERLARQGGKEAVETAIQKTAQKIPSTLDDAATSVVEKLLRSKGTLGDDAVQAASRIDDALAAGDKTAVQKAMQQADDLLSGKNVSWTPKTRTPSTTKKPHKGTTGPVYQGAHRKDPGPFPYRIENTETEGRFLTEDRMIELLKEVKKPFKVPELPTKYKMNFSGKFTPQNTPDQTASIKSDELEASGNARGQKWRHHQKYWQGYETTERMNVVYDRIGHGDQAWNKIIGEAKKKNGWRNREIQEQLNIRAHELAMLKEDPNYISPFVVVEEVPVVEKDPTFNRVKKRLKKVTDYPDKPSKNGYPDTPPQVTTQPYKDRSAYYNKLDPQSAAAMPGGNGYDPNIDSDNAFRKVMKRARANGSNK